jgi:hypothetical protein
MVASLVGIPLEVDKINLKKWEYVRVKIGCKDITKVPAVVEGLLDLHFYDFIFQREIHIEGHNQPGWNTWTRSNEGNDHPSPKKPQRNEEKGFQGSSAGTHDKEAGTSNQQHGKQHAPEGGERSEKGKESNTEDIDKEQSSQDKQGQKEVMQEDRINPTKLSQVRKVRTVCALRSCCHQEVPTETLDPFNRLISETFTGCN